MIVNYRQALTRFVNREVVMICKHIFEWGFVPDCADARQFVPHKEFKRDDGTSGMCNWAICCYRCKNNKNADLVEMFWLDETLHVADFTTPESVGRGNPSSPPSS
jgi:hypothetical protein